MRRGWWLGVLAVAAFTPAASAAFEAVDVVVRFVVPETPVRIGDAFNVDVVADFTSPIISWGMDVGVRPSEVLLQKGPPKIDSMWFAALAPDGDGLAGLAFPLGIVGVNKRLATITFVADAEGEAEIRGWFDAEDPSEGFSIEPGRFVAVEFIPASVRVVPEPGTAVLIGAFGLLLRARRKRFGPG